MITARVVGTVTADIQANGISGGKYFLVEPCSTAGVPYGDVIIAADTVNSGRGDIVLVSGGSSARQTEDTVNKPVDAVIVAIVDLIDEEGKVVYKR